MSELLNKYKEGYEKLVDDLVELHRAHIAFIERQSPRRTIDLSQAIYRIKKHITPLANIVRERGKERSIEYNILHPAKHRANLSRRKNKE